MLRTILRAAFLLIGLLVCSTSHLVYAQQRDYEKSVLRVIELIQQGELEPALQVADLLVNNYPTSRVGYLLKADVLQAMSTELNTIAVGVGNNKQQKIARGLVHEIKNRWQHKQLSTDYTRALLPANLLEIAKYQIILLADMTLGRLYVYENSNGLPKLVTDFYLTIGEKGYGKQIEGDLKTPLGIYKIISSIADNKLPDLYGSGAFPVNYPNRIDKWRERTGYGIWLHGTPSETFARAPWASEGCFVLSNEDFVRISDYVNVADRTPVILAEKIEWLTPEELQQRKQKLLSVVKQWRLDWQSKDIEKYAAHYNQQFFQFGKDSFFDWKKNKVVALADKQFIDVKLEIESLFIYPGERDMFVVQFQQDYNSDNYQGKSNKQQYWQKNQQEKWQIVYEGSVAK